MNHKPVAANGVTTRKVKQLLDAGNGIGEIAETLGLSGGTISYHVRKLKKEGKRNHHENSDSSASANGSGDHFTDLDIQIAHTSGRVEQVIRGYAEGYQISFRTLAEGVARGLLAAARR